MYIAVDIGNTSVSVGLFEGNKLIKTSWFPTRELIKRDIGYIKKELPRKRPEEIIICSVVPKALSKFRGSVEKIYRLKPLVVGEDIEVPIRNLYRKPKQVGQDRLVNAYAAYIKYGGPALVIDFGTAVTFDFISDNGSYLGGIIFPGLDISLENLSRRAALLPAIKLKRPKSFIAKDTVDSMRSGIFFGFGALCRGIIESAKAKISRKAKVILTGGHARLIAPYCGKIDYVDQNLALFGLALILKREL